MYVKDVMTTEVFTVSVDDSTGAAWHLIESRNIHQVPVLEQGRVTGLVKRTDLLRTRSGSSSSTTSDYRSLHDCVHPKVGDIMVTDPPVAHPDMKLSRAAERFCRESVPALPVVEASDNLAGIITRIDVCRVVAERSG